MSSLSRSWSLPERRVAGFAAAAVVFLGAWALLHTHHYTAHRLVDTPVYQEYGDAMRAGSVPYRDFAVEYPPRRAAGVRRADVVERLRRDLRLADGRARRLLPRARRARGSAVVVGRVRRACRRSCSAPSRRRASTSGRPRCSRARSRRCSPTGTGSAGGCSARRRRRSSIRSWSCRSCVVWTLRRAVARELGRSAAIGAAVLAVAFLPFLAVAPRGMWDSVWGQLSRPLQIESLGRVAR